MSAGTPAIRDACAARMAAYDEVSATGFARQFRVTGPIAADSYGRRKLDEFLNRRVICDTDGALGKEPPREVESGALGTRGNPEIVPLPRHPFVWVVDLSTHERLFASTDSLTPYAYDAGLRDKLILPPSHAEMLDVLTTDIEALTQDIVEGKAAGNIILAKGLPGTGKTLTAELYAEIMGRPLLRVHAGTLGTSASKIEGSLKQLFQQVTRWGSAILIDEADVFVMRRGDNIEQSAITAEFLRALEYYPGLIFMTTNRPDDIDEAVLSRCVAIFHFKAPTRAGAVRIWETMAGNFGVDLAPALIEELVTTYPQATGRDIKLMLRTAIRYADAKRMPLNAQVMKRVAMTRGMIADDTYEAAA